MGSLLISIAFFESSSAIPSGEITRPNNPTPTKTLTTPPFVTIRSPTFTRRSFPKITIEEIFLQYLQSYH
jgi:hypothetical protein